VTKKIIKKRIIENKKVLIEFKVSSIFLYGSYVRNEQKKNSDIDILVKFDDSRFNKDYDGYYDNYRRFLMFLKNLLGKKIDLLTEDMLSPYIKPDILKEIELIEKN
jgi:predicted nucleotidyltransferase